MKGFIKCVDASFNIVYTKKDDPRFISGELQTSLHGYVTCKDDDGNTHVVFKNDEKLQETLHPVACKHFVECDIHGKQRIDDYKMKSRVMIPEKYKIYCRKCNEYYLSDNYIPSIDDIEYCRNALNEIHFASSNQQTSKYFKKYMPQFFKIIEQFNLNSNAELQFSEKIYFFKNNIYEHPICNLKNCDDLVILVKRPGYGFGKFCRKHINTNYSSKAEQEIYDFLREHYAGLIEKNYKKYGHELDIFIPEYNLGIEFNGLFWHSERYLDKDYHYNKWKTYHDNGIKLLTIWSDEWEFKKNIVKSIILNALHISNKSDARKYKVKEIDAKRTKIFLQNNHIQGTCNSTINIALVDGNDNIFSLMTFGKKRKILNHKSRDNEYELLRYCNILNYSIRGAASKLFKYFSDKYSPSSVLSFSNLSIGYGKVYEKLKFEFKGYTGIDYWWTDYQHRYHRSGFMKHKLVKAGADKNKTEAEIMNMNGYARVWGLGNTKWEWKNNNIS